MYDDVWIPCEGDIKDSASRLLTDGDVDRFIASVKAEALRDAAEDLRRRHVNNLIKSDYAALLLDRRAEEIEREAYGD